MGTLFVMADTVSGGLSSAFGSALSNVESTCSGYIAQAFALWARYYGHYFGGYHRRKSFQAFCSLTNVAFFLAVNDFLSFTAFLWGENMAIDLYSGCPGAGKSLLATYQGIDFLLCGKNVIANFPFDMNYFRRKKKIGKFTYLKSTEITPKYLIEYSKKNHVRTGSKAKKAQTLVIIDEAEMIFNSRDWNRENRMDWIFFLANHRHLNFDFILISQSDRMLDRQIRALLQTEVKCRAITGFGLTGKILSFVTGGLFVGVPYNYSAKVKFLMPHFFRLHRRKARVYDTMRLFDDKTIPKPETKDGEKHVQRRKVYGKISTS